MAHKKEIEENLKFVARFYRDDTLLPREGWKQFKALHSLSNLRRNIAAAAIGIAILATAASFYYLSSLADRTVTNEEIPAPVPAQTMSPSLRSNTIEFHDASLKEVITEIERLYGVKVANLPEKEIRVTISYEGTAEDVIDTLNGLFDIDLKIEPATDLSPEKQTEEK